FEPATQVVFGQGPVTARLMLVGEQPGDAEDRSGYPFVGPAGAVLDRALGAAGIERSSVYMTNAVKHFSFRREGKRRIHERPKATEMRACRPWLEAEIERVKPTVIVCLGSTAAQSLLGPQIRIQRDRGRVWPSRWAPHLLTSYHPSAVLRADDPAHSDEIYEWLVEDLKRALALGEK
ncbi:MAG: UdgX family uracil-DNA binding protein, partial [Acidobacteria bacterium]|nr:UdgX family uracil-DNA binding protein [Acidobacteriota bacterium]